ncbi:hypothetical protein REPUB_Repub02eG0103300 [Reevesia pubescens]
MIPHKLHQRSLWLPSTPQERIKEKKTSFLFFFFFWEAKFLVFGCAVPYNNNTSSHLKLGSLNEEERIKFKEFFELQRELSDSMKQKIRAEYEAFGGSPDKALPINYFLNIMIIIGTLAILTSLLGNY